MSEAREQADQAPNGVEKQAEERPSIPTRPPTVIDILKVLFAAGSLLVAVAALLISVKSNGLARESNEIAEDAKSVAETQASVPNIPTLEVTYHVAESLDLESTADSRFIERRDLSPVILKTESWRQAMSRRDTDNDSSYLFVFITNYGPGVAKSVTISGEWVPTEGMPEPEAWIETEGSPRFLAPGSFFAMYLADLQGYDSSHSLGDQMLPFREIRLTITFADLIGGDHTIEDKIPGVPPAQMTP